MREKVLDLLSDRSDISLEGRGIECISFGTTTGRVTDGTGGSTDENDRVVVEPCKVDQRQERKQVPHMQRVCGRVDARIHGAWCSGEMRKESARGDVRDEVAGFEFGDEVGRSGGRRRRKVPVGRESMQTRWRG